MFINHSHLPPPIKKKNKKDKKIKKNLKNSKKPLVNAETCARLGWYEEMMMTQPHTAQFQPSTGGY